MYVCYIHVCVYGYTYLHTCIYIYIYVSEVGGMSPNGKSFWFLCMRNVEAKVFLSFVLRLLLRVPFLLANARPEPRKKKFTSRVGYQCKMNGNVACTLRDG